MSICKSKGLAKAIGAEIIAAGSIDCENSRLVICLDGSYPSLTELTMRPSPLRTTRGYYFIKYSPPGAMQYKTKFPFLIGQDLISYTVKTANSVHFRSCAKKIPELQWLIDHTNYSDSLFKIAKMHPGVMIPFCMNVAEYCAPLISELEQYEADNNVKDAIRDNQMLRPLVVRRIRNKKNDYETILKEADFQNTNSSVVASEIEKQYTPNRADAEEE